MSSASTLAAVTTKVRQNWYWGRTHGWANLIEEHDLDPRVRVPRAVRRTAWVARHGSTSRATCPIFLVGAQRSGTNMITHGLDQAVEFDVFNEGNRRAFENWELRDLDVVDTLVARSRRPFALFKPLIESDRVVELIDRPYQGVPARGIWAYRDVEGRVRSHVLKFGASNLLSFRALVAQPSMRTWQTRSLTEEQVELVREHDPARMSPQTASALFWYLRNLQFFGQGLDERPDVMLVDYGMVVASPKPSMRRLCEFIGFPYRPELIAHIAPQRSTPKVPVAIDPRVRELCAGLEERLAAARAKQDADTDAKATAS